MGSAYKYYWVLPVNIHYAIDNGYAIELSGQLDQNLLWSRITFTGTITITGNGKNILFDVNYNGVISLNNDGVKKIKELEKINFICGSLAIYGDGYTANEIIWSLSDQDAYAALNSEKSISVLLEHINTVLRTYGSPERGTYHSFLR